jgi:16S rRNA (guanine527-N7)-methyltransferase
MEDTPLNAAAVDASLRSVGLAQEAATTALLTEFLGLLSRWNRVHNLTGTRGNRELIERHLVESLALRPLLAGARIADVGSGAGFPGIPLAISEPARRFTLIESRAKRAAFLRHVVAELKLTNTAVAHSRAEDLPAGSPFDTVLARAVARPAELLQIVRPLTAPGSVLLVLTSAKLAERLREPRADFAVREVTARVTGELKSAVVMLERTESREWA